MPLGPTTEENDQGIAVPAEIDSIARAEVYPAFEDTGAYAFDTGEVSVLHPDQCCHYLGRSLRIKSIEPSGVRATAFGIDIFPDFDHRRKVTYTLLFLFSKSQRQERPVGSSSGLSLTKEALTRLGMKKGDTLSLTEAPGSGYRLTYDPEFARQTALAEAIMHNDRAVLRALAK